MRQLLATLLAGVLTLLLATAVAATDSQVEVVLSGDGEPPGHPEGSGSAAIVFQWGTGSICWEINIEGIGPASSAHIYAGTDATASELVVALDADGFEDSSRSFVNYPELDLDKGCTEVGAELLQDLGDRAMHTDAPTLFLIVSTEAFPAGALRGAVWVEHVPSAPMPGEPHGGAGPGDCALFAATDPQPGDEGSDMLTIAVDQEVTFWGSFVPNAWVDLTFLLGGEKIGDATPALADAEGSILFLWSFRAGEWTVIASVPETECAGAVELTVTAEGSEPTPTLGPALPDTAGDAPAGPVFPATAALVLLAVGGGAALAVSVMGRMRR
jgi:hypothetical protein